MSTFEQDYIELVNLVVTGGEVRKTRVGMTRQIFGANLLVDSLREGEFPALTTRRLFTKGVLGELAAFLAGATTVAEFEAHGCKYWAPNAMAWKVNEGVPPELWKVGRVYGAQWRNWEGDTDFKGEDQLANLITGIKSDPFGRRHILTTWNPGELHLMCLPPCHVLAQFNVNGGDELECMVTMRSVDLCLGLPADVVLYAGLLCLIAQQTGYKPGSILFSLGDAHVYEQHVPAWEEQCDRSMHELPSYVLNPNATIDNFFANDLQLVNYKYHDPIKYELLV